MSASKKLALAKELIDKGLYEEALQHIKDIEKMEDFTPEEKLRSLYYKGRIYFCFGQPEISLEIGEELYQKSQELNLPLFSLDAISLKSNVFYNLGVPTDEFFKSVEQKEIIFNSIPRDESFEFQRREAHLIFHLAMRDFNINKFDLAIDNCNKGLTLFNRVDPNSYLISYIFMGLAYSYIAKGEINIGLESAKKGLSLTPEGDYFELINRKSVFYGCIGFIYYQKGDLDLALEYYIKAHEISKELMRIDLTIISILEILVAKKDITQAHDYLEELKKYEAKNYNTIGPKMHQFAHALVLKSSPRMRDHVEAENLFKIYAKGTGGIVAFQLKLKALKYLCELYFEEFQRFHQMEVLDDIYPLIDQLQMFAERTNSYLLLALLKLLQAKLVLLQVNLVEARKLLIEAQEIAEEHGLQLLAGEISKEHDHLLEELKLWESFKKEQASVAERLKLASINPVMERLQGRRAIEPLESSGQQPVSLLILAAGGVLLFTYPFSDEWKQDDDLFGSFLSAFVTFSDEFFSQGLDRAKFGKETILLQSVGSFSICYLFQGQTYFAKQKLEKFVETIQKETSIWQTLERFEKLSQVAELKDLPKMDNILSNVFLS